ncbi:MAG: 50S ribosomal protein L25/general stress protein Ctc [Pseudomonadota bacterium]
MSDKLDLVAEIREDQGKGASRRLRRQGKVPAILYGGNRPPRALTLDHNKLLRQMQEESFYSSVLTIKAGERTQPAIVKDIQRHPAKQQILHIDLQRILEDERIRMNVPLHFLNEETAVGIKQNGGVASKLMTEVEITCLPADLPEYFEIDVADVDVDQMLHLTDIKTSGSVEIVQLAQGDDHDQPIFAVNMPKRTTASDDDVDGEAPAEGDAAADEPAADE